MKFEDLKQGSFIKWSANRMFKAWNTFGKVISITEDEVTVMTYDDFKETKLGKGGDAVREEISLCDKNDVSDYLQVRVAKLNTKKVELEVEFKKGTRLIDEQITKLSECVGKF